MYLTKTAGIDLPGIDWWKINFLDNYYFYICIGIGLIIALSDPRVAIEKDDQGKRRFYLHSKFWAIINATVGQMSEYEGSPFSTSLRPAPTGDRISVKSGILWKLAEFFVGAAIIGPLVAKDMSLIYLMLARWAASQNVTWMSFVQGSG